MQTIERFIGLRGGMSVQNSEKNGTEERRRVIRVCGESEMKTQELRRREAVETKMTLSTGHTNKGKRGKRWVFAGVPKSVSGKKRRGKKNETVDRPRKLFQKKYQEDEEEQ